DQVPGLRRRFPAQPGLRRGEPGMHGVNITDLDPDHHRAPGRVGRVDVPQEAFVAALSTQPGDKKTR
ncbi:MAG TPA: hypothetical protein VK584_07505, partial [Streptosporangiaceae bacterium]|nr:hypothetical protein [Streptosporangiaceae bacterium]